MVSLIEAMTLYAVWLSKHRGGLDPLPISVLKEDLLKFFFFSMAPLYFVNMFFFGKLADRALQRSKVPREISVMVTILIVITFGVTISAINGE